MLALHPYFGEQILLSKVGRQSRPNEPTELEADLACCYARREGVHINAIFTSVVEQWFRRLWPHAEIKDMPVVVWVGLT